MVQRKRRYNVAVENLKLAHIKRKKICENNNASNRQIEKQNSERRNEQENKVLSRTECVNVENTSERLTIKFRPGNLFKNWKSHKEDVGATCSSASINREGVKILIQCNVDLKFIGLCSNEMSMTEFQQMIHGYGTSSFIHSNVKKENQTIYINFKPGELFNNRHLYEEDQSATTSFGSVNRSNIFVRFVENEADPLNNSNILSMEETQNLIHKNNFLSNVMINNIENNVRCFGQRGLYRNPVPFNEKYTEIKIATFSAVCYSCNAMRYSNEKAKEGSFYKCCDYGGINVQLWPQFPNELQKIALKKKDVDCTWTLSHVLKYIRVYNSAFQFVSYPGHSLRPCPPGGPQTISIQGTPSYILHAAEVENDTFNESRKSGQIFFLDPEDEIAFRCNFSNVNSDFINVIQNEFEKTNELFKQFYSMRELLNNERRKNPNYNDFYLALTPVQDEITSQPKNIQQRSRAPERYEVALIYPGTDEPEDVILRVYPKNHPPQYLSYIHPLANAMAFPLLFPYGSMSWVPKTNYSDGRNKCISLLRYYNFQMQQRVGRDPHWLHMGKLSEMFFCSMWIQIRSSRLQYLKGQKYQDSIRATSRKGLIDYLTTEAHIQGGRLGRMVLLGPQFVCSSAWYRERFLDAITMCHTFGRPDLFVTMTTNPEWEDILSRLGPNETAYDRPDITAEVFYQKAAILIKNLSRYFGDILCYTAIIEFQKRGLPHMHIVIWLKKKIETSEDVDKVIVAEIPIEEVDAYYYNLVKKFMLHGPCGPHYQHSVCMRRGKCSKGYEKTFCENTIFSNEYGRTSYKRPQNGRFILKNNFSFYNNRVVPHNKAALCELNAHINVEVVTDMNVCKYLFAYEFKGLDLVNIKESLFRKDPDNPNQLIYDEIRQHEVYSYCGAIEAAYRLKEFDMHKCSVNIIKLHCHLENMESVIFNIENPEVAASKPSKSTLLMWFRLNSRNDEDGIKARTMYYAEIPQEFSINTKENEFRRRKIKPKTNLGRIVDVSVRNVELYYLRILLHHRKAATSFKDLKTVNGIQYSSYFATCEALKLTKDDKEHEKVLREAIIGKRPNQLRSLFILMVIYAGVAKPNELYLKFYSQLVADYARKRHSKQFIENTVFRFFREQIIISGNTLEIWPEINTAEENELIIETPNVTFDSEETSYNLNAQQRAFHDVVVAAARDKTVTMGAGNNLFYLQGSGGTGKTFTYKHICSTLKRENISFLCVCWTGIGAILLPGGMTAHYTFGIPLNIFQNKLSNIDLSSYKAHLLQETTVFLWDEITMAPKNALELVDTLMRTIRNVDAPMGGAIFVFGGDPCQTCPIVPFAIGQEVIPYSPFFWKPWNMVQKLILIGNQRAQKDKEFANLLKQIGNGQHQNVPGYNEFVVKLPPKLITNTVDELILHVFEGKPESIEKNVAILCPTNWQATVLNKKIIESMPGEAKLYYSVDTNKDNPLDVQLTPIDYINSLTPQGLPPHKLELKINSIVILLRNLNLNDGLTNGTRLRIVQLGERVLEVEHIVGPRKGEKFYLPRILFTHDGVGTIVPFERYQFPIRLAFCITINKSQGQTLDRVGIYLNTPVFAHGQLYVALSRARKLEDIKIAFGKNLLGHGSEKEENSRKKYYITHNIVYEAILRAANSIGRDIITT